MKNRWFAGLSAILMVISLYMAFIFATPIAAGDNYRIFYFHVPVAWVAFFAFLLTFIWSIAYLRTRKMMWDMYASASAELGLIFTTLVLITGPIWAKSTWGTWWTWDLRLTTSLVLWLIYVAYFLIRSYVPEDERKARFGAVIGIVGFIDVPIVALAIQLAPTTHPPPLIFEGGLDGKQLAALMVCLASFTIFYFVLLGQRVAQKLTEDEIRKLKAD